MGTDCGDGVRGLTPATGKVPVPGAGSAPRDAGMDFGIRGFLETSFLDWPGRLAAVVFIGGCNFRCPFCHNKELVLEPGRLPAIPLGGVLKRLAGLDGWVRSVVVSGGEPTLDPRLPGLLGRLRSAGFGVKLDTNGSRPDVLARLIARGLVQAVDMDVKAPLDAGRYRALAGVPVRVAEIRASVDLLALSGLPHRFRTTWVPGLHRREDLTRMREEIPAESPMIIQAFSPRRVLDPALATLPPPPPAELAELQLACTRVAVTA